MATASGNGSDRGSSAYVPSTLRAVERSVSTLVARFAEPVRDLGARTLGFVDRLMGPRLLSQSMAPVGADARAGSPSLVWPVPWYRQAPAARAATATPAAYRDSTTAAPESAAPSEVVEAGAAFHPAVAAGDVGPLEYVTGDSAPGSVEPTVREARSAAPGRESVAAPPPALPAQPVTVAQPAPVARTSSDAAPPVARATIDAPAPAVTPASAVSPSAPVAVPSSGSGDAAVATPATEAVAQASVESPSAPAQTMSGAPAQSEATTVRGVGGATTGAPAQAAPVANASPAAGVSARGAVPTDGSALRPQAPATSATSATSATTPRPGAPVPFEVAVEQRARDLVASMAAPAGSASVAPAALPPALRNVDVSSISPVAAPSLVPAPEFRAFGHMSWVDQRVQRALAGSVDPARAAAVAATAPTPEFLAAPPSATPAVQRSASATSTPSSRVPATPSVGPALQAPEAVFVDAGPAPAARVATPVAVPTPSTVSSERPREVAAAPSASTSPAESPGAAISPSAATVEGSAPVARTAPPAVAGAVAASAPTSPVGVSVGASTPSESVASVIPVDRLDRPVAEADIRMAASVPGVVAGSPRSGSTPEATTASVSQTSTPGLRGIAAPGAPGGIALPSTVAPMAAVGVGATASLPSAAFSAELPSAWRAAAVGGLETAAATQLFAGGSEALSAVSLPGLGMLRFVERLATWRTAEDTRVLPLRFATPVEYLSLGGGVPSVAASAAGPMGRVVTPQMTPQAVQSAQASSTEHSDSANPVGVSSGAAAVFAPGRATVLPGGLPRGFDAPVVSVADARVDRAVTGSSAAAGAPASVAFSAAAGASPAAARGTLPPGGVEAPGATSRASASAGGATAPQSVAFPALAAPVDAPSYRPGSIGARTEHLAGLVGLRAAGMAIDFLEPAQLAQLPWSPEARAAVERTLLDLGGASSPARSVQATATASPSRGAAATPPAVSVTAETAGAAPSSPADEGTPASAIPSPATDGALPTWLAPGQESVAPQAANFGFSGSVPSPEAWALLSVFPRSAPSALPSAGGWSAPSFPMVSAEPDAVLRGSAAARPTSPRAIAGATAPAGSGLGAAIRAAGESMTVTAASRARAVGGATGAWSAPTGGEATPAPVESASGVAAAGRDITMPFLGFERAVLPDGRQPRGSFLFPRAAEFAATFGQWEPPVTVAAATGGADAVVSGQPAWGGMPAVVTGPVLEALGDSPELATVAHAMSGAPAARGRAATAPGALVALPGGGVAARPAGGFGRLDERGELVSAPDERDYVEGAPQREMVRGRGPGAAPFTRTLVERGSEESTESRSSRAAQEAPSLASLVSGAPSAATPTPTVEATARMMEALRSQQRGGSDERITLADLTLVAVASATQQLAASAHGGGTGAAPGSSASPGGGARNSQNEKSPEAERAEIDALARTVLDEIRQMVAQARERSGEAWES